MRSRSAVVLFATLSMPGCGGDEKKDGQEQQPSSPRAVAIASADLVFEGETVVLSAEASTDPDGDVTSYLWRDTPDGPEITLAEPNQAVTSFVAPDVNGTQAARIQLTVTDSEAQRSSTFISITIVDLNKRPLADAGDDLVVTARQEVSLDGSGSSDPEGAIDTYQWALEQGPALTLLNPTQAGPTFTAPDVTAPTLLVFKLTVTDEEGRTDIDEVRVTVLPKAQKLAFLASSVPSLIDRNRVWPNLVVEVRNHSGQRITAGADAQLTVTLGKKAGAANGVLSGTLAVAATGGQAAFTSLSYDLARAEDDADALVLVATATSGLDLISAESPLIEITWSSSLPAVVGGGPDLDELYVSDLAALPGGAFVIAGSWAGTTRFALSGATTHASTGTDGFVARYESDGTLTWLRKLGGSGYDAVQDVAVVDGDLLIAATYEGTVDFAQAGAPAAVEPEVYGGMDAAVARLDGATGDLEWVAGLGGAGNDEAMVVGADEDGNAYVAGEFNGTADVDPDPAQNADLVSVGARDVFVVKLDGAALAADDLTTALSWQYAMGGDGFDGPTAIAVTSSGEVTLVGAIESSTVAIYFDPPASEERTVPADMAAFVLRLTAAGSFAWGEIFGGDTGHTRATATVLDDAGRVLVGGFFEGACDFDPGASTTSATAVDSDGFVAAFSSAGVFETVLHLHGSTSGGGVATLATAPGNVVLVGGELGDGADLDGTAGAEVSFTERGAFLATYVLDEDPLFTYQGVSTWDATHEDPSLEAVAVVPIDDTYGVFVLGGLPEYDDGNGGTSPDLDTLDLDPRDTTVSRSYEGPAAFLVELDAEGVVVE